MDKKSTTRKRTSDAVIAFSVVAAVYIVMYIFKLGCPIQFATGISCPGCGMVRAYVALLHFNFAEAFHYHPLFPLPAIGAVIYIFRNRLPRKLIQAALYIAVILFITVYLYRMIFMCGDVVRFEPNNNILFRLIRFITG